MLGYGGILTLAYSLSYHLFSNMHENRMSIGDFYDLASFNCLSYFICLGPISGLNRHQRHQDTLFALLARLCCFGALAQSQWTTKILCGHQPQRRNCKARDRFRVADHPLGAHPFRRDATWTKETKVVAAAAEFRSLQIWHSVTPPVGRLYPPNVELDRRKFLKYLTAATVMAKPVLAGSQGPNDMYGLIAKLTAVPGKRAELIRILRESASDMPGCLSYVVAKDSAEENTLWVTEVWDSVTSHDASLSLPSVRNAIPQAKAIVSSFDKIAVTSPVWGVGLEPAHVH